MTLNQLADIERRAALRAQLAAPILGAWCDSAEVFAGGRAKARIDKALQLADFLIEASVEREAAKESELEKALVAATEGAAR